MKKLVLRKYATHLFTTPLSNLISDNMMSRLILTLIKHVFDNQFIHFNIKTLIVIDSITKLVNFEQFKCMFYSKFQNMTL